MKNPKNKRKLSRLIKQLNSRPRLTVHRRGLFGNINLTGLPGSASNVIPCTHPALFHHIEPGIRPAVEVAIASGFDTFSSCEGHVYGPRSSEERHLGIIIEQEELPHWKKLFARINLSCGTSFGLNAAASPKGDPALTCRYRKPVWLTLIIFSVKGKSVDHQTLLLAKLLKSLRGPRLHGKKPRAISKEKARG